MRQSTALISSLFQFFLFYEIHHFTYQCWHLGTSINVHSKHYLHSTSGENTSLHATMFEKERGRRSIDAHLWPINQTQFTSAAQYYVSTHLYSTVINDHVTVSDRQHGYNTQSCNLYVSLQMEPQVFSKTGNTWSWASHCKAEC